LRYRELLRPAFQLASVRQRYKRPICLSGKPVGRLRGNASSGDSNSSFSVLFAKRNIKTITVDWVGSRRIVASLDRKRLGGRLQGGGISARGVFDKETRRKPLAFAADAVRYGISTAAWI